MSLCQSIFQIRHRLIPFAMKFNYLNIYTIDIYFLLNVDYLLIISTFCDILFAFTPDFIITNISNDTFLIGEEYVLLSTCHIYTDTGIFERYFRLSIRYDFENQMNPNDTFVDFILGEFIFYDTINHFQDYGRVFEQIMHWKIRNSLLSS